MDILLCLNDGASSDSDSEPVQKRKKYTVSLDEAIDQEMLDQKKNGTFRSYKELAENRDVIKKFLGPDVVTFFQDTKNQKLKQLEQYITDRICATFDFTPILNNNCLTLEECNWLSDFTLFIVRIVYRTFEPMSLTSKIYYNRSFMQVFVNCLNKLKEDRFCANLFNNLSIQCDRNEPLPEDLDPNREEELREEARKKAIEDLNLTTTYVATLFSKIPSGAFILAERRYMEYTVNELRDDPENVFTTFDDTEMPPEAKILPKRADKIINKPIASKVASTLCIPLKSILKARGKYYSDEDVHLLDRKTRIEYSKNYTKRKKKSVTFAQSPPKCRLVYIHNVERIINEHKAYIGVSKSITYPVDYKNLCCNPGEPFTIGHEITYDEYRYYYHPNKHATAITRLKRSDNTENQHYPLKSVPIRPTPKNIPKTQIIAAHKGMRGNSTEPLINQNSLLFSHFLKLIRYGTFWKPHVYKKSAYNFCYGSMLISDALLEDADPNYLNNTGLFAFPPPFNRKTIVAWLDELKPRDFDIRHIVVTWGFQQLIDGKSPAVAITELITTYQLISKVIKRKHQEFQRAGYSRIQCPQFWLLTVPVADSIKSNTDTYNDTIRTLAKIMEIGIIDWDAALETHNIYVTEDSAESQIMVLYELLKDKIGLNRYVSNNEKAEILSSSYGYPNIHEWKEKYYKQ